jgi:uncharacterized protein YraI
LKKLISLILALTLISSLSAGFAASAGDFSDVDQGAWYYDAVDFVVQEGLFNGTTRTTFSPQDSMTRGMFVTVLGRYANINAAGSGIGVITKTNVNVRSGPSTSSSVVAMLDVNAVVDILGYDSGWFLVRFGDVSGYVRGDLMTAYNSTFVDVSYAKYYSTYVQWAYLNNIAYSTSATTFSPDADITREEICSMLYNYAAYAHLDISPELARTSFADDSEIGDQYRDAVYAMQQLGVVNGRGDGLFAPKDSATRAEVSMFLKRFVENAKYQYGTPVPESTSVSDNYFDDACFIGHSIVVGMSNYFQLPNADFLAVNGISASRMLTYDRFPLEQPAPSGDDRTGTLRDVLTEKSYGKIYIMLGTNELGPEADHRQAYYNSMLRLVSLVQELQPDAVIYLLSTLPVSKETSEDSAYFNRENILAYNELLTEVAAQRETFYLDVFTLLADAEGYLPTTSCLSDGIHILVPQYNQIKTYLKSHTMYA